MKLSRRCFLSLTVGGAVGTALTPLPWKLTDDLSIWSQNWAWTPVPPEGAYAYIHSTCALCPAHCAIRVRKVDERAVKIEGRQGRLCPLGLSGLQLLYAPWRVPGPLKRKGRRGEGLWEPISWAQAIGEVAARLSDLRSQGKAHAVAALTAREAGTVPWLLQRLLSACGSPNFVRLPSLQDTQETVFSLTQGIKGFAGLDVEHADFILSFGSALLDGFDRPDRMMQALARIREKKGTFVQVEQRLSNTAAKADVWLAPKPGSEAHLALGMACAIIEQGKYDRDFIALRSEGFNAFAAMLQADYSPDAVAERTGIPAETIVRTAISFAQAGHPLAVYGKGKGGRPVGLKEALAVQALNALAGNLDRPGGAHTVPAYDYLDWPDPQPDAAAAAGLKMPRIDGAGNSQHPHARHLPHRLLEAALNGSGPLQLLMVAEANPCHDLPGSARVREAFQKIPFVVSFSSFMDETALQADLILPNHLYLERYEDLPVLAGTTRPRIGLCQPVVAPVLKTRHIGDSLIQIAHALEGSVAAAFPWQDYESCLRASFGAHWNVMLDQGFWCDPEGGAAPGPGFRNPGRFCFMNDGMAAVYKSEGPAPAGDTTFPLVLMPYDSIRIAGEQIGGPPFLLKILPHTALKGKESVVELHPQTGRRLGLSEGQEAVLRTPLSEARVRLHFDEGIMPDIVCMVRGLGHTAGGPYAGGKGINANQLIAAVEDPASALDAAWGIRAKLTPA